MAVSETADAAFCPSRALLTGCGAIWGLAVGLSSIHLLRRPAPPDQLPGLMTGAGLDAGGPFLWILLLPVCAFAGAVFGRMLSRFFESVGPASGCHQVPGGWALIAVCVSLVAGPWVALSGGGVLLTLVPGAGALAFTMLRNYPARWSGADVLVVPAFLAAHLALLEIFIHLQPVACALLAGSIVVASRLLVCRGWTAMEGKGKHEPGTGRLPVAPALTFVGAPLALLAETRIATADRPVDGAVALLMVCGIPFAIRALGPRVQALRPMRHVAYPVAILLYAHILAGSPTPVLNLFEHGFGLINASEMLRGEMLYRDVLPAHGPLADGVIDWVGMRIGGPTLGAALTARYAVALLAPLAIYAVGLALTGSAGLSFLAVLGSISLSPAPVTALAELSSILFLRSVPSLVSLACSAMALRLRSKRWLLSGAALAVVAGLTSLEFGVYAFAAVLLAVLRFSREWSGRVRAMTWAAAGGGLVALPVGLYVASKGLLGAWLHATFVEVPALSSAYNLGFATAQDCCKGVAFPEVLLFGLVDPEIFPFVAWGLVAAVFVSALALSPFGSSRRGGPLYLVAAWIIVCGVSFAERKHIYFHLLLPPLLAGVAWQLMRFRGAPRGEAARRLRLALAAGMALMLAAVTHLPLHLTEAMPIAARDREDIMRRDLTTYPPLPRARGALLRKEDAARLELIRPIFERELRGDAETFFSFTNLPVLHFLFDRPVPIRLPEVPMYETAAAQKEIIATLERDRNVRLALVSVPYWSNRIDGVPNEIRAPMVRDYLRLRFEVIFAERGLVVLRRKEAHGPTA